MRYQALVGVVAVAGLSMVGIGSAGADPVNAKNGRVLTIDCQKLGPVEIAVNGNGEWSPGHDTSSNMVLHPYEFHETGTFTPTGGAPQPFTNDFVKPAPSNGRLDTCTFHEEGSDPGGSFVVDGTVKGSYTKG